MPRTPLAQFLEKVAAKKSPAGLLLLGPDAYLRDLCREKIIDTYVAPGARDWAVKRFSPREASAGDILREAQTLPMLVPLQVLVVSEVEAWERLGEESREELVEQLNAYFENPAPFTIVVLEAAKLDQRTKLYKALADAVLVVEADLGGDPAQRIPAATAMTLRMARDTGVAIDKDAAQELAEITNGELGLIRCEIEKLATYVGEGKRITTADVEALVVSEKKYSIWELTDMLANRQRDRAILFLDRLLAEGQQPPAIVGALAWMYRKLIEAHELPPGAQPMQAVRKLGVRPETAQMILRAVRRLPRTELLAGLETLYETDSRLKSAGADDRAVLEFAVAQLTAAPRT
ncbi:MAG TPA: DNA polymerase III subunit delta [Candidatus Acidoferrales bacterium]